MKIDEVHANLAKDPTIMGLDREISYFHQLQQIPEAELLSNWGLLQDILDRLSTSHIDDFCSVNDTNRAIVFQFVDWLRRLGAASPREKAILNDYADVFTATPNK